VGRSEVKDGLKKMVDAILFAERDTAFYGDPGTFFGRVELSAR
jgi:hypothetical protein